MLITESVHWLKGFWMDKRKGYIQAKWIPYLFSRTGKGWNDRWRFTCFQHDAKRPDVTPPMKPIVVVDGG
uniref:DDE_5 domain-containing protein n=1 Tax=Panagrellus redivivus TaxID=6233 RepID=A0A7E4UMA6_PANRE